MPVYYTAKWYGSIQEVIWYIMEIVLTRYVLKRLKYQVSTNLVHFLLNIHEYINAC